MVSVRFAGKLKYHQCGIPDTEIADITTAGASALLYITAALDASPSSCVLVHCASGVSRSVAVVIYYLMRKEGMGFEAAMSRIRAAHPAAHPNRGFVAQLKALDDTCSQDHPVSTANGRCSISRGGACASRGSEDGSGKAQARGTSQSERPISRVASWARMPSVESFGWMTRASYPSARECGWAVSRSSSSVDVAPRSSSVVSRTVSAVSRTSSVVPPFLSTASVSKPTWGEHATALEGVKEKGKEEDVHADRDQSDCSCAEVRSDEDSKSVASTSLALSEGAVSEGSEISEGELSEKDFSAGNSPRACVPASSSQTLVGGEEGIVLFWHKSPSF